MVYNIAKKSALDSIQKAADSGLYDLDQMKKLRDWIETDNAETVLDILKACDIFGVTVK